MTKQQKTTLARILVAGVLFAVGLVAAYQELLTDDQLLYIYLPAYLIIGYDIVWNAVTGLFGGQVFDENFLMTIATIGALLIGEYPESVAVMLFYQVGELFQSYAVGKSRKSIGELMDIRPDYANIRREGQLIQVSPEEVLPGDEIVVLAGERVPLDGRVSEGISSVDTSALTGESVPRTMKKGDEVLSGSINLNGVLVVQVTREYAQSTVAQILDLVENASSKKANVENFITRFARYYTPLVVLAAVLLATVPPFLLGMGNFEDWIYPALSFLVVSCPCALVISVPLSFFGGIGGASRQGILVKGSNYLEQLAETKVVVFDKTGTLTHGVFEVVEMVPAEGISKEELLEVTALAESFSNHPIATSLKEKYGKEPDHSRVEGFEDLAGFGIKVLVDGRAVYAGNTRLMKELEMEYFPQSVIGTEVHVAREGEYLGHFVIADRVKEDSPIMIQDLNRRGIETVMLTGDAQPVGEAVARELGIQKVYTQLLPQDKVDKLEEILDETHAKGGKVAFVGDGINDAPVLTRADIGISMGALGSDAAIEASDIVLMDDQPSKIATAMKIAKRTLRIVRQNIWFALGIKFLVLALTAFGKATMWQAIFADVGVSVIAILNAMRALRIHGDDAPKKDYQEMVAAS